MRLPRELRIALHGAFGALLRSQALAAAATASLRGSPAHEAAALRFRIEPRAGHRALLVA